MHDTPLQNSALFSLFQATQQASNSQYTHTRTQYLPIFSPELTSPLLYPPPLFARSAMHPAACPLFDICDLFSACRQPVLLKNLFILCVHFPNLLAEEQNLLFSPVWNEPSACRSRSSTSGSWAGCDKCKCQMLMLSFHTLNSSCRASRWVPLRQRLWEARLQRPQWGLPGPRNPPEILQTDSGALL